MTYQLHHGNMIDILPMMERDSIDAIITDPPYGLGFMGKDWDHGVPGEHFWREAYRVAKPGAHLLAFGGTRTFHRLACAIEDAGWEMRDCVMWVYGQGFPKSHDVSKAIDREAGAEREVTGLYIAPDGNGRPYCHKGMTSREEQVKQGYRPDGDPYSSEALDGTPRNVTSPATPAAAEWDGWGTALKPAWEPIIVARKPLQGTVAENVQRYGTGAMNVDGCRIETDWTQSELVKSGLAGYKPSDKGTQQCDRGDNVRNANMQGRWPANLIHDGSAEVLAGFAAFGEKGSFIKTNKYMGRTHVHNPNAMAGSIGTITKTAEYLDTGSAARFFYCAKASKQDRDEGCEGLDQRIKPAFEGDTRPCHADGSSQLNNSGVSATHGNHHPTVKPTALMRYLCRLVTPPDGVILDPFMGSGSTGKAAILEGFNFVGVDNNIEYVEIAARRIEHACGKVGIVVDQPMMFDSKRETVDRPKQLILL